MEVVILFTIYMMKIFFQINKKDVNVVVCYMEIRFNESKALVKHILCDYKCRFDVGRYSPNQN